MEYQDYGQFVTIDEIIDRGGCFDVPPEFNMIATIGAA